MTPENQERSCVHDRGVDWSYYPENNYDTQKLITYQHNVRLGRKYSKSEKPECPWCSTKENQKETPNPKPSDICPDCGFSGTHFCTGKKHINEEGIPIIPRLPDHVGRTFDPHRVVAICGECGLRLTAVMGYVCSNTRCPTGLGGPTC